MKCQLQSNDPYLLFAMLLVTSNAASAYITAPLEKVCPRDEDLSNEMDLQPDSDFFRQRSLVLEGSGERSAALLVAKMADPPCALVVEAPKDTHAITVSLSNFPKDAPCPLSLWSYDGKSKNESWYLDMCDREKRGLLALYPEVYPHRVTLRWNARTTPEMSTTLTEPIEIVVTAVARGSLCDEETRVLCWKMLKESLCVSEEFACDGRINCPHPGNEESVSMCPIQRKDDHVKRILAVKSGDVSDLVLPGDARRSDAPSRGRIPNGGAAFDDEFEESEEVADHRDGRSKGFFGALPRLGPGSYVLLGMLTCGSVLLICGIWECCCRVRHQSATISVSQRGSLVPRGSIGPTTFVIISSSSPPPPQYEDLEQPPTYRDLFPAKAKTTVQF
ncbi:uncharacterized protein LOC124158855 isoform X2 [Ischnura elegans]|uniref:uncharacterized protein LOC124158855 isoform X2 n=1 Tax=Ischnura elegans TaxID=197161 RepID=UPI001ED868C4|nr:uncharacterized protein LOC124158855 isoform X2 [Ischnura elegans]